MALLGAEAILFFFARIIKITETFRFTVSVTAKKCFTTFHTVKSELLH